MSLSATMVCRECGGAKALESMSKPLLKRCLDCVAERNRQWRLRHPGRSAELALKYYHRPENKVKKRDYDLRRKYGISLGEFNAMMEDQNRLCLVCEADLGTKYAVDHCHETGRIRGVIHIRCNSALGLLNDDPALLRRAADYLETAGQP